MAANTRSYYDGEVYRIRKASSNIVTADLYIFEEYEDSSNLADFSKQANAYKAPNFVYNPGCLLYPKHPSYSNLTTRLDLL